MPRFRSLSTNTPPPRNSPAQSGSASPTLLTRGFRSLRRARRQSNSVPSSPMPAASHSTPRSTTSSTSQQQQHLQQPNTLPLQQYNSAPMSTASSSISSSGPSATHHVRNSSDLAASHHHHNREEQQQQQQQQQQQRQNNSTHGPHIRLVPNVGIGNRCFVFEIIDRTLEPGVILKIGRYSDRNVAPDRLSFKSKVVSRSHAELWVPADDNKIFIRDVGSSSGTFVNRARLSLAGVRSSAQEIKDGDLIQLGVDYQGGIEPMYRAVRIRLEVNREPAVSHPFSRAAFQQLRSHLLAAVAPTAAATAARHNNEEEVVVDHAQPFPNTIRARQPHSILLEDHSDRSEDDDEEDDLVKATTPTNKLLQHQHIQDQSSPHTTTVRGSPVVNQSDIQECCICLYAIAPFQALFIAPCSHIFHFKCLRPILFQNYPGFSCPICRTYSDLEASVAVEVSDVLETLGLSSSAPPKVEGREDDEDEHASGHSTNEDDDEDHHHPLRTYATVHGDGRHASSSVILEETPEHQNHQHRQPSSSHEQEDDHDNENNRGQAESEEGAPAAGQTTPGGLSVPSRASSQRNAHHHGDGLLSTTLVATPPTFEEMLTASSMSPTHR
ncbi:hypothetical protein BDB00DRAFT_237737 [Zychaea mexicana]|uniref:uncharacterized protein n=1 Tax=Zychaea mexicana TaxID=64656 RepID=UPI0022FDE3D4|nr:uncharacterized protein BDB00DRAFT_237737 [Zychaea mexicana]KAI9495551.1 hypothetical protein BDB00DRAFT_237737 [Zychaea mexicana]